MAPSSRPEGQVPVEIGVVEDDGGGLAPELQGGRLHLVAAGGGDLAAGHGAAGEGDHVDTGVRHQRLPHRHAAGEDAEQPGREPGLLERLGQQVGGQGRFGGGLQQDRAAHEQRREDLRDGRHHRGVPGDDPGHDADGFAQHDDLAGHPGAHFPEGDRPPIDQQPGEERADAVGGGPQELPHPAHLVDLEVDRLGGPPLERSHEPGEALGPLVE